MGGWLRLMLWELNKQAEFGVHTGVKILNDEGNVWAELQLLMSQAGSVASFVDTLATRKPTSKIARAFPERSETLRLFAGSTYDFDSVLKVRNGMAHIDERIEELWLAIDATEDEPEPEIHARTVGSLSDGRERIINWDQETYTVAFRSRSAAPTYTEVDMRELTEELRRIQVASSQAWAWLTFGSGDFAVTPVAASTPPETPAR